jgi:PQQ-like domain
MREDFVTQLQHQLRQATERDARRGRLRRGARTARLDVSPPLALAAVAAAAVAALALVFAPFRHQEERVPAGGGLTVVANQALLERGGELQAGFGAVWAADAGSGEILRVDPRSRTVQGRVSSASFATTVGVGEGSVWAVAGGELLRIDPGDSTVAARLDLDLPEGVGFVIPGKDAMWVVDALELQRVDTDRMRIDRKVDIARGSFMVRGLAHDAEAIYVQTADGTLATYDAASGERRASLRLTRPGMVTGIVPGGLLFVSEDGVSAIDPRTGATRWSRGLGTTDINGTATQGSTIWVQGTPERGRDRLWQIDSRDGGVLASLTLPEFGVESMITVGRAVWLVSPGGRITVVEPS